MKENIPASANEKTLSSVNGCSCISMGDSVKRTSIRRKKEINMAETNNNSDLETGTKEIEALYVQSARGMAYENGQLTLEGIAPTTIIFSDRPDRVTGHIPLDEFLDSWGEGDDSFADDPPNAALSIFTEDEIHDVIVVLGDPQLDGDQLSYSVDILDGEIPASGGPSSLFIDMIGRPMSAVSVAGCHRRGRRRGRRRERRRMI
jgi:hypothetical protein